MRLGRFWRLWLLAAAAAFAQDSDQRWGSYRVLNSYEVGLRSSHVAGSREMYRSSVNYGNGLRLIDGMLRVNSGDGRGRFFDEIVLTSFGSGGDPYQASSLRIEKNGLYRYDFGFRIVNYANRLLSLSGGEHGFNTERVFQSHDLTLFPQSRVQLVLGFDRNNQNGPAISSEYVTATREDAFPRDRFFVYAEDIRRLNNTWRVGGNITAGGMRISLLQGWDFYKEDTRHAATAAVTVGAPTRALRRDDPVHGQTPFSRLNIHTDANRRFAINGRLVYAGGERNFVLDENIASLNPMGVEVSRQAYVLGQANRTQGTGDLTLGWQPAERWALSNTTTVNQTRITGDSAFIEVRSPLSPSDPGRNEYFFGLLGIRMVSNSTDVNFRPAKTVGLYGGYHYSIRRIQNRESVEDVGGGPGDAPLFSFENRSHSGLAGIRWQPRSLLRVLFDFEYGTADRPFTPASEKSFHAQTVRAQYKRNGLLLTASFQAYRNRNRVPSILGALEGPASLHHAESRQFSTGVAWTPRSRFTLDASYGRAHLDTESGIVNFPVPGQQRPPSRRSLFVSRLHHGRASGRVELRKNVTFSLGYSIVKDTAAGRNPATAALGVLTSYPSFTFDGADLINAYPLSYHSPQARLSVKLHKKATWNAGWQYYGYNERFFGAQNYHAHVSYTSVRWAF